VPFFRTTSRVGVVSPARLSNHGVSSSQPEIARVHEAPESILQTEGFSTMSRGHACLSVPAIVIGLETGVGKNMTGRLNCRNRYTRQIEPRWMGAKRPTRQKARRGRLGLFAIVSGERWEPLEVRLGGRGDLIPRAASSSSAPSDGRSDFNSRQSRPCFLFHLYFDVLQLDEGPHLVPIYIVRWI
jgi:hypothetical protein